MVKATTIVTDDMNVRFCFEGEAIFADVIEKTDLNNIKEIRDGTMTILEMTKNKIEFEVPLYWLKHYDEDNSSKELSAFLDEAWLAFARCFDDYEEAD